MNTDKKPKLVLLLAIPFLAMACGKSPPAAPADKIAKPAPSAANGEGATAGNSPGGDRLRAAAALRLDPGQFLLGVIPDPKAGALASVSVKIGNYKNRSDGSLLLKVCQMEKCGQGDLAMAGSEDNKEIAFRIDPVLSVDSGQPLTWTLSRKDGSNAAAVWTYPSKSNAGILLSDGTVQKRTPRISLQYARN